MALSLLVVILLAVMRLVSAILIPLEPMITQAPQVFARDLPPTIIGYVSSGTSFSPVECISTLTWQTSGNFGRCCPTTTTCVFVTGCASISAVLYSSTSATCITAGNICVIDYVVNSYGDSNTIEFIGCEVSRFPLTLIRTPPSSTSTPVTITPPSPPTVTPPTVTPPTVTPPTVTPPTPTTSTLTPPPSPATSSSSNDAWIAGAVVGPLAGIAIIAAIVFWIMRRKPMSNSQSQITAQPPMADPQYQPQMPPYQSPMTNPQSQYPQNAPYQPPPPQNPQYLQNPQGAMYSPQQQQMSQMPPQNPQYLQNPQGAMYSQQQQMSPMPSPQDIQQYPNSPPQYSQDLESKELMASVPDIRTTSPQPISPMSTGAMGYGTNQQPGQQPGQHVVGAGEHPTGMSELGVDTERH